MVRIALAREGLRAPAELNIASRIRQELGASVAPCTVLYVDDPAVLLEAVVFDRGAALLIPQPLVVTGDNRHTDVFVRSPELPWGAIPESVRDPLHGLHVRMTRAIESVADRQEAHVAVTFFRETTKSIRRNAMRVDTEQRIETTPVVETSAKPPPHFEGDRSDFLFQTVDELHGRHGTSPGAGHRVMNTVVALIGGALLFASLYAVILFLE